jgi:hypothetical protein
MSGNFQHKVLSFDMTPPDQVWSKIADQLDEEFKTADIHLSQKMHDCEIIPPAFIFDRILSGIDTNAEAKSTHKVFRLPIRRLAAAAVIIGLIAVSVFYIVQSHSTTTPATPTAETPVPSPDETVPPPSTADQNNQANPNASLPDRGLTSSEKSTRKRPTRPDKRFPPNQENRRYASLTPILQASFVSPISVSAPLICDGDGKMILDENLVSASDQNYIIVTSPNGEQTKVSRKFLKVLTILNGGSRNVFINPATFLLKARCEQWRNKLLQQASYIPTANNYLDIMDLKQIIQEN